MSHDIGESRSGISRRELLSRAGGLAAAAALPWAVAWPMPLAPPVTSTFLPLKTTHACFLSVSSVVGRRSAWPRETRQDPSLSRVPVSCRRS